MESIWDACIRANRTHQTSSESAAMEVVHA